MTSEIFWQRHPDINHTSSVRRQARHTMLRALWELHRKSSSCNTCLLRKGDGHIFRLKTTDSRIRLFIQKTLKVSFSPGLLDSFFQKFHDTKWYKRHAKVIVTAQQHREGVPEILHTWRPDSFCLAPTSRESGTMLECSHWRISSRNHSRS